MLKTHNIQIQGNLAVMDPSTTQMNTFRSYVTTLADPNCKDDLKLKATQEICENFETITQSPLYGTFLDHSIKIFLNVLQEGTPHFIAEYNIHQVRKLILELIHRLPTNDLLRPYVKPILSLTLKLVEIENEDNVLVCLKIIIELHKHYRPSFNLEVQNFLQFVKGIYSNLPNQMDKIFSPKLPIYIKDLASMNIDELLSEAFVQTTIQIEKRTKDGSPIMYNLLPRSRLSLKVLQELPIIVVLMYQLYNHTVRQDICDYVPLIMQTICLQPSPQQRLSDSFNKEIYVDFMGAQIKTLSFLAYVIKIYHEVVATHSTMMVQGMIQLLALCPMEVAHLRRELLIAARHILATDLRNKFVPHIDRLFYDDVLLGKGWTAHESLRPLAYSTLADLVHHVRQQLPLVDLTRAVNLFSKNVHDENLATTIQTMSCKLLLNLVDCIRVRSEIENSPEGTHLLLRMLEVFVLKFKTISQLQLPILMAKCKQAQTVPPPESPTDLKTEPDFKITNDIYETPQSDSQNTKECRSKIGFPAPISNNYNVSDYRSLVKTLVCGVKTITWGYSACKSSSTQQSIKQFRPHETLLFIRLVKWALKALDIYTINMSSQLMGINRVSQQTLRAKEEKEVLEHFSGVFSMMNSQTFHEIFSTTIDYLVERVYKNITLQIIPNTLLANLATSPIFATVLVEYLLERMEEMGLNVERSNLYLRLFKLVFGSVSLFPQENENMLRPHLHKIVNRSMELALSAKEPYNYFLLLRALFRSIGGGSHDLLYQEFLPLLPSLLEGLNRLQSSLHKQHMKDLFVELCLTVPVRLSSLLPYLPMLMDPLVSALNGSHVLISQGLRTLELCVDNLQHDFLYEHIQPVRADLMQALWHTLHSNEQLAQIAFKVLGKFGGGNRKMMIEAQRLEYISTDYDPPSIVTAFYDQQHAIEFPVEKIIDTAFNALKQSSTDSFYRKQAWNVINSFLTASVDLNDNKKTLINLFLHPSFLDENNIAQFKGTSYKSINKVSRETHQTALTGMFVAVAIKELRSLVLTTVVAIVRHYTMVAVAQQAGPFAINPRPNEQIVLDPLVLIDALAVIMGHEEKELCKPGVFAFAIILETAICILGSKEMACKLPLIEYLSEKMCSLCYERAWYAKLGGCIAIKFLFERCAIKWVYDHTFTFLKALLFVMVDLNGEVSNGALDLAKINLEKMLVICVKPIDDADAATKEKQKKALYIITHELVRQVTSTHTLVREQAMASLRLLAEKQNKSITAVMEPFRDVLADMIPPKKHLLKHQPAVAQMGLMDGNTFCTTLSPRLFSIDTSIKEHNLFIVDLISLCNTAESKLISYACYKNITNFNSLRSSALRLLGACHYLEGDIRSQIFQTLYKMLEKPNPELQEVAFKCMKQYISGCPLEKELVNQAMRPLLFTLGDPEKLTLNSFKVLCYLTQLFPMQFNEKLCDQLFEILQQILNNVVKNHRTTTNLLCKKDEEVQKAVTIISIFCETRAASTRFIKQLCHIIFLAEQSLLIEASSPFREVLMKFLVRYPLESINMLLRDNYIKDQQHSRFLVYMLKHADGKIVREHIQNFEVRRLITMALANTHISFNLTETERNEIQHQSIRIISLLIKFDDQWLSTQQDLIEALKQIWCTDEYQERHKKIETVDYTHWNETKLLVKILLHYFCHHPNDIDLLFQLLRAVCDRFIPEFQFLKDFLENTVAQNYTVEWKRSAFFRLVELFPQKTMSQDLKAKVIQLLIIPCFLVSFERGEINKLIGGAPTLTQDSLDTVVAVFINKLIDPDIAFPFVVSDYLRIALLQFSCLLVEQAWPYVHVQDTANKALQGLKLRKLMTFAWPCLLVKNCVDPATRYHGHLLLSHIIDKFAIHRKIVLQVFHSLLKAHAVEARGVVRQALEILTPSMPLRMDEGNTMLIHWTKKIIVEEGHSMQQLFHILQLVVKHYKVYYPVRHDIIQNMVSSIQRLGFSPTATLEHRKLAVELAEVIIKWELYGIKDEQSENTLIEETTLKRPAIDESIEPLPKRLAIQMANGQPGPSFVSYPLLPSKSETDILKPIDGAHIDTVLNSLLRLACQVNDAPSTTLTLAASPGELLSRRCVLLLRTALKPDIWAQAPDIKLSIFDKILLGLETPNPNIGNICTALEVLTFLLTILKKKQLLSSFKQIQRGLAVCITSTNAKVIKVLHNFLAKLMSIFPSERTNANVACKYEELEALYSNVGKVIFEGLTNYEKNQQVNSSALFSAVMILKAVCINNNSYIDLLITPFMKVLNRLAKDHLQPIISDSSPMTSELLILCLDLIKTRVVVLGVEMRKTFIGTILVSLIEKSSDIKVMKAITKMLEEWMKNKNVITLSQAPSLREKSILLVKLMVYIEKRFADDVELNAQFLELVNYVYTDDQLKQTELTSKLEAAFMTGLRCNQPQIRSRFFKIFDLSMRRRLHDRLLYIVCSQNWEAIGQHYWIKQCIELLMGSVSTETRIQMSHESSILPNITSVIQMADEEKREEFYAVTQDSDIFENVVIKEEYLDIDNFSSESNPIVADTTLNRAQSISELISKHYEFVEACNVITTDHFVLAAAQLCHMDTELAEQVWLQLFPRLWDVLDEMQKTVLTQELLPFVTSGTHTLQRDCHPSAVNTFVEALSRCKPPIQLIPPLMKYLGKTHNLWHRMTLMLEDMAFDPNTNSKASNSATSYDFEPEPTSRSELMDSLAEMYWLLKEEDLWAGLWAKHAHYKETNAAIAYEQHGYFEQAQSAFEAAMARHKQDTNANGPLPSCTQREVLIWTEHWIRCAKELNQWQALLDYCKNGVYDPYMVLDCSWRFSAWDVMKDALSNVEFCCPKDIAWKVTLYSGYLLLCNPEDKPIKFVERYVDSAIVLCLNEWRRLPHIVSHIHLPLLQASQQIMELQEAFHIHKGLSQGHQNSVHDMKAIVKTWRNRLPVIGDELSHWNDIFAWRQHHYQYIVSHYENTTDTNQANSMLGVHATAQSIICFGKIARKHKLTSVCIESLNKIYGITSVPIIDCFQKIRQQVKCYLQLASISNKNELQEGLEIINSTNVKYFSKEMTADFYAHKGMLYHLSNKTDEANKSFSAAVQMHDTSVKAWALYGDYLEQIFMKEPKQINLGVNAMTCFLHACRHQTETKARKHLAKVLWLLSYDDEIGSLMEAIDKYSVGVPAVLWVPWIPQLLSCLVQYDGNVILNLLLQVGRMFPQAVYFPIRTLYLTLRAAAARKTNVQQQSQEMHAESSQAALSSQSQDGSGSMTPSSTTSETSSIKATPAMVRCSKIMKMQRDIHTTVLTSIEGIADQMEWFRENWYEEVVRQLRQGLAKCYAIAFENRESVNDVKVTPHISNFVKKVVSTFGIGVENIATTSNTIFMSTASESLARRAEATYQDPVFKEMKIEFAKDFDFSQSGTMRLHTLIDKLKKWIKILENRSKMLIQSFFIEEKCRFLSNFTLKTAEIELPGEFLLPRHTHYYVRIARFMPRVDIVQKHNGAARRLYIRGHNGKIYPYLVVNDSGLADARREERVLQILRMLNHYLSKQKETAKRFLHLTVPRVVALSQQVRLVEDNPSSISLLDIFKKGCTKLNIEHDNPIQFYYERLASIQSRGIKASHQVYREILKGVQTTLVPRNMLRKWAAATFPSATDYWQFRKMFMLQMALVCFVEYVLHLTRLNPDMIYLHQDSGLVNIAYFKFDIDDSTGELDTTRPVPFRLTPNIVDFLSTVSITGGLTASMIETARCLIYPNFKVLAIFKTILRDEMLLSRIKKPEENESQSQEDLPSGEQLINLVNKATTAISNRLNSLAHLDGYESKVGTLVAAAFSQDNLCRMDPAWHPWL